MVAAYPRAIKAFTAKPGLIEAVMAVDVNDLQDEVAALQKTLGVDPVRQSDPGRTINWSTLAERMDALDNGLTSPVFSSWIGGLGDIASSVTTSGSYYADPVYGPWTNYATADSPDNFPGGMHGRTPSHTPAYEVYNLPNGQPWPYCWEWNLQSEYVSHVQAQILASGGEVTSTQYRTVVQKLVNWSSTVSTKSPTDAKGIFTLPKPATGYDPFSMYNGVNGFVIKKRGWYHLNASASWQASASVEPDTTRRLTLFGDGLPLAIRDVQGTIGGEGDHKRVEHIGILQPGTLLTLGIKSFKTGNAPLDRVALSPALSGSFLRDV